MSLGALYLREVCRGELHPFEKILLYDGSPNGAATANFRGQICRDYTNSNWYISTDGSTAWTQVDQ